MATQVHVTHYGFDGYGRTVTAAKQDAGRAAERLVERVRTGLAMVVVHGWSAIVFPDAYGWSYTRNERETTGSLWAMSSSYETRDEAIARCQMHLAQNAWSHELVEANEEAWLADAGITDRAMVRELLGWFAWQRRARAFREAHPELGDNTWRQAFDEAERERQVVR